jgi:hypothetical protein
MALQYTCRGFILGYLCTRQKFLIVTDFGGNNNFKELREVSVKKNQSLIN